MTTTAVKLLKDGAGGYHTADGRWIVTPITMGDGVNNNGGWSKGRKVWVLRDTTGVVRFGGRSTKILDRLYEARDMIAHYAGGS